MLRGSVTAARHRWTYVAATTQLPCFLAQKDPNRRSRRPRSIGTTNQGRRASYSSAKQSWKRLSACAKNQLAATPLEVWERSYAHMNDVLSGDVWGQPPIASQRGTMTLEEWLEPVFYDSTVPHLGPIPSNRCPTQPRRRSMQGCLSDTDQYQRISRYAISWRISAGKRQSV